MKKLGLLEIERINAITIKRVALLGQLHEREQKPPSPKVGAWRHSYYLDALRSKIQLLETKRTLILKDIEAKRETRA